MKKMYLIGLFVLAIAVGISVFNVNLNLRSDNSLSGVDVENSIALADDEGGDSNTLKPTTQTVTDYVYDKDGKLIKTITYQEDCCVDGSLACSHKACGAD